MSELLRRIIYDGKRERRYIEETTIGGIIVPLIKMHESCVYIYGGGNDIEIIVMFFMNLGVKIEGIIDKDDEKNKGIVLEKIPYMSPDSFQKHIDRSKENICIINTMYFKELEETEIIHFLTNSGIDYLYVLTPEEKFQIKGLNPNYNQTNFAKYFFNHVEELCVTYDNLFDEYSKDAFREYIRVYMQAGIYHQYQCDGRYKYFYGMDRDGVLEEIYSKNCNDIWVNCGANRGDNIFWFFQNGLMANKIYAFEGDKNAYMQLLGNLKFLPEEKRKIVVPINEMIDENTKFDEMIKERVSFINADIEGAEQDLINVMGDIIKKDRPVLALCIYHRADDLVTIPLRLKQLVKDYIFVIRKYWASAHSTNGAAELVLFAIPPERFSDGFIWHK